MRNIHMDQDLVLEDQTLKWRVSRLNPGFQGVVCGWFSPEKLVHHQHVYLKKHGDIVVYQQDLGTHMTHMEFEKQTSKNNKTLRIWPKTKVVRLRWPESNRQLNQDNIWRFDDWSHQLPSCHNVILQTECPWFVHQNSFFQNMTFIPNELMGWSDWNKMTWFVAFAWVCYRLIQCVFNNSTDESWQMCAKHMATSFPHLSGRLHFGISMTLFIHVPASFVPHVVLGKVHDVLYPNGCNTKRNKNMVYPGIFSHALPPPQRLVERDDR